MNGKIEYLCMTVFVVVILTSQLAYAADSDSTWTVEGIRIDGGWPQASSIVKIQDGYRMYFSDATNSYYPIISELRNPKGLARPAASAFCLKVLDGRKFR